MTGGTPPASRPAANGDIYKWLCGLLLGALLGTWSGEFIPNRALVTSADLQKSQQPLTTAVANLSNEVASLRDEVNDMKGQLKVRNMLQPSATQ